MKNIKPGLILAGLVLMALPVFSQSWKIDTSKASIKFVTSGPFGEVDGSLAGLKGTITFDPNSPEKGSMEVTLNPNTIESGVGMRNTHLKEKEEFFNTAKYPLISFKSKQLKKSANGYTVTGDLTIKTVTKSIDIPFSFDKTATGGTFKGSFVMDSHDYTVNDSSKKVTVNLEVPVTK
ncbi:MAG TPA: YceI family protein [Bacteroidia bacterium]|jgi:polyisoprenoid-binding protein YceI|nr:YceI family protein [Bacteroidia bacterium]